MTRKTTPPVTPPGATLHLGGTAYASPDLAPLLVPIESVTGWPGNPRRHDQDNITASIRDLGMWAGIVTQSATDRCLVGHGRLAALLELGATHVPRTRMDVDDLRGAAIVARDNQTSDASSNDATQLIDLLATLAHNDDLLALSGHTADELAVLRRTQAADFRPEAGDDPRLDQLDPRPCAKCGYDNANDPEQLVTPR